MMETLRNAIGWLKRNAAALLTLLGALASALILYQSKRTKVSSVKEALKVEQTKREIAKDEAQAAQLRSQADAKESDVKELEAKIAASKRRVVEIQEGKALPHETDDGIQRRFSDSGL